MLRMDMQHANFVKRLYKMLEIHELAHKPALLQYYPCSMRLSGTELTFWQCKALSAKTRTLSCTVSLLLEIARGAACPVAALGGFAILDMMAVQVCMRPAITCSG